jgi:multidrug efflux pump subunit AcrB
MLRTFAALSVLGLLAVALLASLNGGGNVVAGLLPDSDRSEVMVNTNTGQPLTLEMVQRDVKWHRDTARKLRELD